MKIVYSYYVLDLIHSGHLYQMKQAKSIAGPDGLSIVGILTDEATMEKKHRPVMSLSERMELAQAVKYNDVVVAQNTYSPVKNIKRLKPNCVLESTSHDESLIDEVCKVTEQLGGLVIVVPYTDVFEYSSTSIKKGKTKRKLEQYQKYHVPMHKSIVWRLIGIAMLAGITFSITRDIPITTYVTVLHHTLFAFIYYFHDLIWGQYHLLEGKFYRLPVKAFTYEILLGFLVLGSLLLIFTGDFKSVTIISSIYLSLRYIGFNIFDKLWNKIK